MQFTNIEVETKALFSLLFYFLNLLLKVKKFIYEGSFVVSILLYIYINYLCILA